MNRSFKKLSVSVFATLLLCAASTATYASWYCVKMATHGESGWSGRDNKIGLKFVYDYEIKNHKGTLKGSYSTDGRGEYDVPHFSYDYGGKHVCIDMEMLQIGLRSFVASANEEEHGFAFPPNSVANITGVKADIRWGDNCPKGNLSQNHFFRVWRRSGNHVFPFDCDVLRVGNDSPIADTREREFQEKDQRKKLNPKNFFQTVQKAMPHIWKNHYPGMITVQQHRRGLLAQVDGIRANASDAVKEANLAAQANDRQVAALESAAESSNEPMSDATKAAIWKTKNHAARFRKMATGFTEVADDATKLRKPVYNARGGNAIHARGQGVTALQTKLGNRYAKFVALTEKGKDAAPGVLAELTSLINDAPDKRQSKKAYGPDEEVPEQ
ncbi:MAG: hypothetical protein ACR2P7_08250 [bacterium]